MTNCDRTDGNLSFKSEYVIVRKAENPGYQFFLSQKCFQKLLSSGSWRSLLNSVVKCRKCDFGVPGSSLIETRAITEHDHTPHQCIVIEQVLVTDKSSGQN